MTTSSRAVRATSSRIGGADKSRKTKSSQSGGRTLLSAVNEAVGNSLSDSVDSMKDRVTEQIAAHGEQYLNDAGKRISEVTAKVVKWGKKNPIKSAAAAAALIAVSTFLYSTMGKSSASSN